MTESERAGIEMLKLRDSLVGTASRPRARGKKRQTAFEAARRELARLKFIPNSWWSLQSVFEEQAAAARSQIRRRHRAPRDQCLFLSRAIADGYPADEEELAHYATQQPNLAAVPRGPLVTDECLPVTLEQHASIEVKELKSRGWLSPGRIVGWHLGWPSELTSWGDILMIIDTRDEHSMFIQLEYSADGQSRPVHQQIRVRRRPSMPGRLFLECPVFGTTHQSLFLRHGLFASARAQGLRHRSQEALSDG